MKYTVVNNKNNFDNDPLTKAILCKIENDKHKIQASQSRLINYLWRTMSTIKSVPRVVFSLQFIFLHTEKCRQTDVSDYVNKASNSLSSS